LVALYRESEDGRLFIREEGLSKHEKVDSIRPERRGEGKILSERTRRRNKGAERVSASEKRGEPLTEEGGVLGRASDPVKIKDGSSNKFSLKSRASLTKGEKIRGTLLPYTTCLDRT